MQTRNQVLGSGKLYFDKFLPDTETRTGERYIGNTPSLSTTGTYTDLPHYDADNGLTEQDDNVTIRVDRNGSFTCDNISAENVALMFGGADPFSETIVAAPGSSDTFLTVKPGYYYQLGASESVPDGAGNVSNVVVTNNSGLRAFGAITVGGQPVADEVMTLNGATITFKAASPGLHEVLIGASTSATAQNLIAEINAFPGIYDVEASGATNIVSVRAIATGTGGNSIGLTETVAAAGFTVSGATLAGGSASGAIGATGNYTVDLARGRIYILETSPDIADGDDLEVQYDLGTSTRTTMIDSNTSAEGALRFIANNAKGTDKDYFWPRVKITPNGEYALKGETWQMMAFNFAVLKPTTGNRVYVRDVAA